MRNESGHYLQAESHRQRHMFQLILLLLVIVGTLFLLAQAKVLILPILLSVTIYFVLNPIVTFLERAGQSRALSAALVTILFFVPAYLALSWIVSSLYSDLAAFENAIPRYVTFAQDRLHSLEAALIGRFAWLSDENISGLVIDYVHQQSRNFLSNSPEILSAVLWTAVLVPLLSFFLLKDAIVIRNLVLNLTPNRFFELSFTLSYHIERKIGAFIIAKLAEAFLVGILTLAGLLFIEFPYAVLFSVIAGVTNTIPYFGPILGFAPILAIPFFSPNYGEMMAPALIVSVAVNVIDTLLIFPLLVSKVIDLHPLVVLLSVIIGGSIAGPLGLILAIPAAAIIKLVCLELIGADSRHHRI